MSEQKENKELTVTSEKTIHEIYDIAKSDRERAVEAYNDMKTKIEKLPSEKLNSMYFQALNQAQQLVQTATDKLVELAKVLSKNEATANVNQFNMDFSGSDILEEKAESFKTKADKLGVSKAMKLN